MLLPALNWQAMLAKVGMVLLYTGVVAGGAVFFTHRYDVGRQAVATVQAVTKAADTGQKQGAVTTQAAIKEDKTQEKVRVVYRTIIKEVPKYVPQKADAACTVNAGAVRMLSAAARGVRPAPDDPRQPNAAPSGIALSALVGAADEDFATCRANAKQLTNLQQAVRDLYAVTKTKVTP